mgnify:CR=1 FL=1
MRGGLERYESAMDFDASLSESFDVLILECESEFLPTNASIGAVASIEGGSRGDRSLCCVLDSVATTGSHCIPVAASRV